MMSHFAYRNALCDRLGDTALFKRLLNYANTI